MKINILFSLIFLSIFTMSALAQDNQPAIKTNTSSIENISVEITKISKSLQTFNKRIKDLLEQFALNKGNQLNEKQQKLLFGYEILNRAEQRLEILQKFQIELAEKEASIKTRLAQIEQEIKPESIDRNVTFIGTTKTDEMREGRRRTLEAERGSLQTLFSQIRQNLIQTSSELRQAETLVTHLRRKILPQVEMEISNL
ncbi:MAG: hypothetical protein LC768_05400 [Acidobacteria bacterium]|nr:hypothetical protein [Acidobacteriota bacterium]MCA1637762.1 hypothetical protein [Acidobacteriota bacterium]